MLSYTSTMSDHTTKLINMQIVISYGRTVLLFPNRATPDVPFAEATLRTSPLPPWALHSFILPHLTPVPIPWHICRATI
jgi:hypothetical protein